MYSQPLSSPVHGLTLHHRVHSPTFYDTRHALASSFLSGSVRDQVALRRKAQLSGRWDGMLRHCSFGHPQPERITSDCTYCMHDATFYVNSLEKALVVAMVSSPVTSHSSIFKHLGDFTGLLRIKSLHLRPVSTTVPGLYGLPPAGA